jgi:hypothetical protein
MKTKLNYWLFGCLVVFGSLFIASDAYADKSDKIIFADAYCIIPSNHPENPLGIDVKISLADGIIKTTVDGSTSAADFKDLTAGSDKVINLANGEVLAAAPLEHVCLSVQGNSAIVWQKFTTSTAFGDAGDLMLVNYVDNGDRSGTVKFLNVTRSDGITSISGCSQSDASLLQSVPLKQTHGIINKDGA